MSNSQIFFDRPEILQFIFYPRRDFTNECSLPNATNRFILVEDDVSIGCRFYFHDQKSPNILYFHGNGEVVSDYDHVAPFYNQKNINLFVVDYRGYGFSDGTPTCTDMISDAHKIFKSFLHMLKEKGHTGSIFIMGRSLGSISAIELAYHYQDQVKGMIIESGLANILEVFENIGFPVKSLDIQEEPSFSNLIKIGSISIPTLIIHAEYDSLIPLKEARDLFDNVATSNKEILIIPKADHNTIMDLGMDEYFETIETFVFS